MPRAPPDWEEILRQARSWAEAGDPHGMETLLRALRWRYETARNQAVEALVELAPASETSLLELLASAETAVERGAAADTLGLMKSRRAVPSLREALQDPHMVVRRAAIRALWRLGDTAAVPAVAALLRDPSGGVRILAAHVLGRFGDPVAVPDLLEALGETKWYVRQAAARALGEIGEPRALDALRAATRDPRPAVARAAQEALQALEGRRA